MRKIILTIMTISVFGYGWEVNTHRAIDKSAMEDSSAINLKKFINLSGIKNESYANEKFEAYGVTYFEYFNKEKSSDAMAKLNQTFQDSKYLSLIEAGCMLEDAQWQNNAWLGGNGRFLNHFYNPQDSGDGLWNNASALEWAKGLKGSRYNYYSFPEALHYFKRAFSDSKPKDRHKYQAKMLVSVGHLMHLVNDMNVPAHTRADAHPFGDPLETWMKGGSSHQDDTGFYVRGNKIVNKRYSGSDIIHKYSKFEDGMINEAQYTSKHFFSKDTIPYNKTLDNTPLPSINNMTIPKSNHHPSYYNYVTDSQGRRMAVVYWSHWFGVEKVTIDNSTISNAVHNDYGKVLIPRAIANAAGFLSYFFRGSMSVNSGDGVVTVSNDSDENVVASPDIVTFKNGTLKFYCDDANDTRSEFHSEDITDTAVGNELASIGKDTLYADFQNNDCNKSKNVTILFDGTIGKERGLSVAVIPASDIVSANGGGDSDQDKVCAKDYFSGGKITEELKKGDKDEGVSNGTKHQVKELQTFLKEIGYDVGTSGANHDGLDGWFGGDTESALMNFQEDHQLDKTGTTDKQTRDIINQSSCHERLKK